MEGTFQGVVEVVLLHLCTTLDIMRAWYCEGCEGCYEKEKYPYRKVLYDYRGFVISRQLKRVDNIPEG